MTDQTEGRLIRAAKFLQEHRARLGYGIITLLIAAAGLVLSVVTFFSGLLLVASLLVVAIVACVAIYFFIEFIKADDERSRRISTLEEGKSILEQDITNLNQQKESLEDTVTTFQEQYTTMFAGLLSILANQVLDYGPTERISVYRHDDNKSGFRMVSRYSDNHEFSRPSERTIYPDDEGAIGKAWQEARFVVAELPKPDEDLNCYLKVSEQHWKIKEEVVKEFTMKSCSYAAFPLKHPHGGEYGNIAIVVFESTEKNSLQVDKLKDEMNGAEGERIAKFLITNEAIEPRADIASEQGV